MTRIGFPLAVIVSLLTACTTSDTGPSDPSLAEQAAELNEVFEAPEQYSLRTVDTTTIQGFLAARPEYQAYSADILSFYQRRNQQMAWFHGDTLSQAALNFLSLVDAADSALGQVESAHLALHELAMRLADETDTIPLTETFITNIELDLTGQFFVFADRKYGGVVRKDLRELDWFIPRRKKNFQQLIDSLAAGRMDLSPIEPVHPQYQLLKRELKRLYALAWLDTLPPVDIGNTRKLEPGDRHKAVPGIRTRLIAFGDMEAGTDTLDRMDSLTVAGIRRFQERHGLGNDGVVGKGFLKQINVRVSDRITTLLVNMERLRWVPERQAPDLIMVNIPEFRMHIYEQDTVAWSMNVVVGNVATRTVIFSDELSTIVFSPYWSIPKSIVRGEILPGVKKDNNYLSRKGMEVVSGGKVIPASSIDWSQYSGSIPYSIRQKPGAGNSLGLVKFLFPNEYSIYFHDTPSKSLFGRDSRAFSHGCIRLGEPTRLANYLLRNDTAWTEEKIDEAMHGGKQIYVQLSETRPVLIGYFTAWVDRQGRLNFRDDVYGHDARLTQELFSLPEPKADPT